MPNKLGVAFPAAVLRPRRHLLAVIIALSTLTCGVTATEAATVTFYNRSGVMIRIESRFPNGANGPSVTIANNSAGKVSFNTYSLRVRAVAPGGQLFPSGTHLYTHSRSATVKRNGRYLMIR